LLPTYIDALFLKIPARRCTAADYVSLETVEYSNLEYDNASNSSRLNKSGYSLAVLFYRNTVARLEGGDYMSVFSKYQNSEL